MALDGRKGTQNPSSTRRPSPATRQSPSSTANSTSSGYDRDRYPAPPPQSRAAIDGRERSTMSRERYPPPPPEGRERSPLRADPYDDRYRDPYRDAPPPRAIYRRDDPYADPYRRPPLPDDPYYDRYREDPYSRYPPPPPRRDPYADPYRDPYFREPAYEAPVVRKPPPPLDCSIIILNSSLMKFAEFVERKLKAVNVFCSISLINEERTIPQVVEDAAKKLCLFAIVVNSQNEVHQSLTVNILHGTPQEHRNMPVDDAITLIGRSFDAYQLAKREKETAAARPAAVTPAPARAPPPFVPPSQDILYLLNLLADKRQLTIEELDKVITYLTERRNVLLEAEGRIPPKSSYPDRDPELMSSRHLKRPLDSADMYSDPSEALRTSQYIDRLMSIGKSEEIPIDAQDIYQKQIQAALLKIKAENAMLAKVKVEPFSAPQKPALLSVPEPVQPTHLLETPVGSSHGQLLSLFDVKSQIPSLFDTPVQPTSLLGTPNLEMNPSDLFETALGNSKVQSLMSMDVGPNKKARLSGPQPLMLQDVQPTRSLERMSQHGNQRKERVQGDEPRSREERKMNKVDGPPVMPAIADVLKTVCTTTANMYQLVERYNIPQNCLYLKPPIVHQYLFSQIDARQRSYDNFLQSMQMQLAVAVVPLIQTCAFFENSITIDNEVVYQLLKDSMLLLCNFILETTVKRRHLLRNHLPKEVRWLCVRKMVIGEHFFPEEFLGNTEDAKALRQAFDKAHKTGEEEKHIFAQQLLNKKRVDDTLSDIPTWSKIAELVNISSTLPVNQQLVKKLKEKYLIPENCQCLRPPTGNPSIWNKMSREAIHDDRDLQNPQRLIGHAIVPIIRMLESIKFVNVQPLKMFSMLKETLYILCTTQREISVMRRRYLKNALPEPLKVKCDSRIPITRYLCGDGTESYGAGEPKPDTQKDLQAKILSILNGPGEGAGLGGMVGLSQQPQGNGSMDGRQAPGGMSSLINLDNPNVQKALDNLIQSGPNLLKTLSHAPGNPLQPGAAITSRESQHTQPQPSMGQNQGYPPRGQPMGMQQGVRPPFGGPGGQPMRMSNPGGIPPRRPPPQY
ncbi:uncharacterized protein LOC143080046 isoform X6 [Mytilus galloprovincialis]